MANKNPRKIQQYDVCFDHNGNLSEYYWDKPDLSKPVPKWQIDRDAHYEPNCIFADKFEFVKCYPTNGSAHFIFRSLTNGREHSMCLSDFQDLMKAKRIIDGFMIQGEFTFCKRGSSQGMRMIIENQDP